MLRRVRDLWYRVWFHELPPYPLGAFRIAFGAYLLGYFLRYFSIVELSFSDQGVYVPYLIPDIAPSPLGAWLIYGLTLVSIACLILGFFTRISAVFVFCLYQYHFYLNFAVNNTAYDRLNILILFILCFVDSGACWSMDARRRTSVRLIPAWHIRLLQFQLTAVYFGSGLWKLCNPNWHTGDMIQYTLGSAWASPIAFEVLRLNWPEWWFTCLAWGVVVFELAAGFTLYFRKTRLPTVIVGALFHLSNVFILLIPGFLNCVTMYALFFEYKQGGPMASRGGQAVSPGGIAADSHNKTRQ